MLTGAHIIIEGRVQGVFFRAFTQKNALKLKIKGRVRNTPDGCVEVICEGRKEDIEGLIKELWKGPAFSIPRDVRTEWKEYKSEFKDFAIKY